MRQYFLLFFLNISFVSGNFNQVKLMACSASANQGSYHCSESMDGVSSGDAGNGWAICTNVCQLPQNVVYDLEWPVYLDHIRIVSAVNRNDHYVTTIKLEDLNLLFCLLTSKLLIISYQ